MGSSPHPLSIFPRSLTSFGYFVTIKQWFYIVVGSLILSIGFSVFMNPYNIIPGGVYGLGISFHYLFPSIQVGTFGLLLDIPLLLLSLYMFGGRIGVKTIVSALLIPLFMNFPVWYWGLENPVLDFIRGVDLSNDLLLSSLFGGLFIGFGFGLILRTHATSGGTDIIAMIISKRFHLPMSSSVLLIDTFVIIFGLIIIGDWKLPLYSLVSIFVISKVVHFVLEGGSNEKLIFIFTDKQVELRRFILDTMCRGGTYIKSSGMYSGIERDMIFVVISRREIVVFQDYVRVLDPSAFMVVLNAHETLGDGFKSFSDNV